MTNPFDGLPEPWAVEWGEDRYGVFAGFAVGNVVQRMRWIPPGRFVMGSPEGEAGRYEDETQHEVKIANGFWLGDTPVTQALWEAVMGNNPSHFKTPDRPVEMVSWDDCQEFIGRLNEMVPALEARLPTEEEWEYACRAGTTTTTWVGNWEILGPCDAPSIDSIAWYAGNCGVDFELNDGYDTVDWPRKQYPHTKGGTHPVRRKAPNPWGIYDMLGNVFEMCSDYYAPYTADATQEKLPVLIGNERIIRGGSAGSRARKIRAAARGALHERNRDNDLGLRLACGGSTR